MNQLACNSPHFVFWVGKKNTKLQNFFWNQVNLIADKKFSDAFGLIENLKVLHAVNKDDLKILLAAYILI